MIFMSLKAALSLASALLGTMQVLNPSLAASDTLTSGMVTERTHTHSSDRKILS